MKHNPHMGINETIRDNLRLWMSSSANLDHVTKVAQKSGIAKENVRRAWKGEGNPTIKTLEGIAAAFGRSVADLVAEHLQPATDEPTAQEAVFRYPTRDRRDERMKRIAALLAETDDDGLIAAIERLEDIQIKYPLRRPQKGAL